MQAKEKIPQQETGAQSNTESSTELSTIEEAKSFYGVVKERLLNVNNWQKWAGAATAHFQLTDEEGKEVQRPVQKGDYFKIDIPGPGTLTGDGDDWVQVENIEEVATEKEQSTIITVRPAPSPTNRNEDVAHFFDESATSTFIVSREGNKVSAGVHGRNEKPNLKTESLTDKIRNAVTALGASAAFSKLQWKSLVSGLVEKDKE